MPRYTIDARDCNLAHVFCDEYAFEVPGYQRPYAWGEEQAAELVQDIHDAMANHDGDPGDLPPYFLGTIVLIKQPGQARAQVVDGQQRLTTLTILYSVLRELVDGQEAKKSVNARISTLGDRFAGVSPQMRFVPRTQDIEFFRDNVQQQGNLVMFMENDPNQGDLSDSQKRVLENTKYIYNELSGMENTHIDGFTKFLTQRCYLVIVSTSDKDAAYRIFSVMNNRGLDLSPVDILKADIVGEIQENEEGEESIETYTMQWESAEDSLGREHFEHLFGHIRMIHTMEKPRLSLERGVRKIVENSGSAMKFVDNVLLPYADCYDTVCNASYSGGSNEDDINSYLRHLGRINNRDWQPPAMAFLKHNENERTLTCFVRDLDRLAYALFITKFNINQRINRYAKVLHAIKDGDDLFDDGSPLQLAKDERRNVRRTLRETITRQPADLKTLLLRLDSMFTEGGAKYDRKVITVEHVLPRNPSDDSQWMLWFPDEDLRNRWVNKLANLVLLSRRANSAAGNFEFERKKREYFQRQKVPPFALTAQVLSTREWTPESLKSRQKFLCEKIEKVWRLRTEYL